MTLTLSVIVPAYNAAGFIDATLTAILDQLGPRHELIVIDDGSTDRTGALVEARRLAHGGGNFRLLPQSNLGISVARNSGLAAAGGAYIVFVDSDDILLAGALAALDAVIAAHHPDVIACDFQMWHPERPDKNRRVALGHAAGRLIGERDQILSTFFADRHMYVWSNVFRRAVYGMLDAPVFPPNRVFEDVATVPRLLSECQSLYYLTHALIDYRQHPASITKSVSEKWCGDFAAALPQARAHLARRGIGAAARMQFDMAAAHFYVDVVKSSFQLPQRQGRRVRAQIKPLFIDSLFNEPELVLASMAAATPDANGRRGERHAARQVKRALDDSVVFGLVQTLSRRFQLWRRARHNARGK